MTTWKEKAQTAGLTILGIILIGGALGLIALPLGLALLPNRAQERILAKPADDQRVQDFVCGMAFVAYLVSDRPYEERCAEPLAYVENHGVPIMEFLRSTK